LVDLPRARTRWQLTHLLAPRASAATIIRLPFVYTLTHSQDFLWDTTDVAIWSSVEPGIGITAISLATLRPLFRKFLLKVGLSTRSDNAVYDFHDRSGGPMPNGFPLSPAPKDPESRSKVKGRACSWRPKVPPKDYRQKDGYFQQNSDEGDYGDEETGFRSLAPRMGNTSHVEGGLSRKPSALKLKKGGSRSRGHSRSRTNSRVATTSLRGRGSGSEEDFQITKTMDVVTWSGDELIKVGWDGKELPYDGGGGVQMPEKVRRK
jgi:hypothetical protein